MRFVSSWVVLSWVLCASVCGRDLATWERTFGMRPSLRIVPYEEYITLRDDATGLLTGNELLKVFYSACDAIRGVVNLLNNPVFSVLGISGTVMHIPLPIPMTYLDPLGIPSFIQGTLLNLQNSIGKRSLPEERLIVQLRSIDEKHQTRLSALLERADETLTVGMVIDALDYPCQCLDVVHSFLNNSTYVGWLNLGDWPLPLRDPLHKLNLMGVPGKIFGSVFSG